MIIQRPIKITIEDWEQTPEKVKAYIADQEAELQRIKELWGKNSRNSSRPPSSDRPDQKEKKEKKRGQRQAGAQKGHRKYERPLKPVEEVDEVIEVKPEVCRHCGEALEGSDGEPHRHQVTEIPPVKPVVTEYRIHSLACPRCGEKTRGEMPEGIGERAFGVRVQSLVSMMSGVYRMSRRQIQELMAEVFGVEMSLGTVKNLEGDTSEALAEAVEKAKNYVKTRKRRNMDETSWREKGRRKWLWVLLTQWVVVFALRSSRGSGVAKEMLGEGLTEGVVINTDGYSAYNWISLEQRQLCWAHLKRQFQAYADYGGEAKPIGEGLLAQTQEMFSLWHKLKRGEIEREVFKAKVGPVRRKVFALLEQGAACGHQKTADSCAHLLKFEPALWTFVEAEGVEPTNNEAEREIRSGVIWRRHSLGTQSESGSLFVERMLTVRATLRRQHRNTLEYLIAANQARLLDRPAPSLLPNAA